jgi:hypothetical protein
MKRRFFITLLLSNLFISNSYSEYFTAIPNVESSTVIAQKVVYPIKMLHNPSFDGAAAAYYQAGVSIVNGNHDQVGGGGYMGIQSYPNGGSYALFSYWVPDRKFDDYRLTPGRYDMGCYKTRHGSAEGYFVSCHTKLPPKNNISILNNHMYNMVMEHSSNKDYDIFTFSVIDTTDPSQSYTIGSITMPRETKQPSARS